MKPSSTILFNFKISCYSLTLYLHSSKIFLGDKMKTVSRPKAILIYILAIIICIVGLVPGYVKGLKNNESQKPTQKVNEQTTTIPTIVSSESEATVAETPETTIQNNQTATTKNTGKTTVKTSGNKGSNALNNSGSNSGNMSGNYSPVFSGGLSVKGRKLVNSSGKQVQLRGVSTHGLAWFPQYVNASLISELKTKWNCNVIRLAMYTAEYGGYCTGGNRENLKRLINNGVSYATNNGMYAIIDWHILSDGNPNTHINEAKSFFAEMANKYKNNSHVIYEICNEPNGGTSWSQIKSYAETIIGVIRQYDGDAVVIVGTPTWSQEVDKAVANPITKYSNIMYAFHFYAGTHQESYRNTVAAAINAGLPIFVTEFGISDASGNGGLNESQGNKWISLLNKYGISYCAWNLSNKSESSALISSGCSKTSGFSYSDLSPSGKWYYNILTGKTSLQGVDSGITSAKNTTTYTYIPPTTTAVQTTKAVIGTPAYSLKLSNSWVSGEETFYQYELSLTNKSNENYTGWKVTIPFNETVKLSSGWCGNYTVSGNKLTITSMDYNGQINKGSSISNIGFIVSGSKNLKAS